MTAAGFEFDVLDGFDNASMQAAAIPSTPADLDLYLQRLQEDGSWGADLAAAETSALDGEHLTAGRLPPGRYRILVHNWAGGPVTADVTVRFLNQEGVAGG